MVGVRGQGVWLSGVNGTTESDSMMAMAPQSLTQRCQWHRRVFFAYANISAKSKPFAKMLQIWNNGPRWVRILKKKKCWSKYRNTVPFMPISGLSCHRVLLLWMFAVHISLSKIFYNIEYCQVTVKDSSYWNIKLLTDVLAILYFNLNWDCLVISLKHIFFLVIISPNNDPTVYGTTLLKYVFIFYFFICIRINQRWAPITAWTIKKISLNNYSIF